MKKYQRTEKEGIWQLSGGFKKCSFIQKAQWLYIKQ